MSARTFYLSFGSNLGDREANIRKAIDALVSKGVVVVKISSLYETAPQDVVDQPWFLNLVAECQADLFPMRMIKTLLRVEHSLGRRRSEAVTRGPRVIDIDILLAGRAVIRTPMLTVPHPRMTTRRFVLEPLVEIAPHLRDPVTGQSYRDLLASVQTQKVRKLEKADPQGADRP